jgi:predicted small metal-binding protein
MAYTLACGDIVPGCDATFSAETPEELMALAGPHGAEVHGLTDLTPEQMAAIQGAVKQT